MNKHSENDSDSDNDNETNCDDGMEYTIERDSGAIDLRPECEIKRLASIEYIEKKLNNCYEYMKKFKADLDRNAFYAFEWADSHIRNVADIKVYEEALRF